MGMAIKKGDKFRVNKDDCCGGFRNGDVFVAVRDGECEGDVTFYDNEGDLRLINQEQITFVDDFGDPWDYKPALKIEAGKYYRTRDGRKVGPVKDAPNDVSFEWESPDAYYDANGRAPGLDDEFDLIAEWVDEPVAAQPAKFKVGDRVRFVTDSPAYGASHTDGVLTVRSVFPDGDVKCSYPDGSDDYTQFINPDDLELVTEPAATLFVDITADTSELDAEIDRIKRKLKKLSKKARKLGIALDYDLAA